MLNFEAIIIVIKVNVLLKNHYAMLCYAIKKLYLAN